MTRSAEMRPPGSVYNIPAHITQCAFVVSRSSDKTASRAAACSIMYYTSKTTTNLCKMILPRVEEGYEKSHELPSNR